MADDLKAAAQKELLRRRAAQELERRRATKASTPVGEDMAKGFGTGVAQGAISIPGMFGDAAQLNSDILSGAASRLGAPQSVQDVAATVGRYSLGPLGMGPTSQQIKGAVEGVAGPMYEANTVPGQYAQTMGQFVPAAAMGPGGLLRKAVPAVAGALGSETAGQMTKGEASEPYARLAGGLLGGGAAATATRGNALKQAIKSAPAEAEVVKAKNASYAALKNAGIKFDADGYQQFAGGLATRLAQDGLDPVLHPLSSRALELVVKEAGTSPDFTKMDTLRKIAGDVLNSADAAERRMGSIIMRELDNFAENSALISNGSVPAGKVTELAKRARELARRTIIMRDLNEMDRKAGWYVSGDESGIRNQVASYGKGPKGKRLTKSEQEALKKVSRREGVQSLLTTAGGRLNLAVGPSLLGSAGFLVGGPIGAGLAAGGSLAGHLASRKIMEIASKRALDKARKTVLLGRDRQAIAAKKQGLLNRNLAPRIGLLAPASQSGN